MTAFRRLHRLRSFKDSFESLFELSDSELQIITDEIQRTAGDPDLDNDIPDELSEAYSALIFVRSIAGEEGLEELLDDVRSAYPQQPALDRLAPHFVPAEGEVEARAIREAETETLPILTSARVSVDFRVSTASDDSIKLVPLLISRLDFDEQVGGSEAATFQASAYALSRLRDDIDDALNLLEASAKAIGSKLLYPPTIKRYLS